MTKLLPHPLLEFSKCKSDGTTAAYHKPDLYACMTREYCANKVYHGTMVFCKVPVVETIMKNKAKESAAAEKATKQQSEQNPNNNSE